MSREVLTVQEVANYLRIDIRTVYRLAKRGDIPCTKIGRQWRFRRDTIQGLISMNSGSDPSDRGLPRRFLD